MKTQFFCLVIVAVSGCHTPQRFPEPKQVYNPPPLIPDAPLASLIQPVPAPQLLPARTLVSGKDFVVKDVSAKMAKIDDIGLLFVRHNDGDLVLAQSAAWKYGLNGSASGSLNPYLNSGANLVIFALYNHKAKALPFGKTVLNKWHYDLALFGDGTAIFSNANEGSEAKNGVMEFMAFSVESSNGQFIVSKASASQMAMLEPAFIKINNDFSNHPASDNVTDISAAIAVGIRTAGN